MTEITLFFRGVLLSLVGYDDGKVEPIETKSLSGVATKEPEPWTFRGDTAQFPVPISENWLMPFTNEGKWDFDAEATFKVVTVHLTRYAVNDIGQVYYIDLVFVPETQKWYSRRPVQARVYR